MDDSTPRPAATGLSVGQRGLVALVALAALLISGVVGGLLGGAGGASASTEPPSQRESITVTGTGEVTGTPDVLRVDFAVETTADTVAQALDRANRALDRMRTTLRRAGVKPADLQTADLAVSPQYSDDGKEVAGYQASQRLTAKYRDLGKAGASISATVAAGGDAARVQGLWFDLDDDAGLLDDARKAAVAAATAKADLLATAAGRSIGRVVRIEEQAASPEPIPYAARDAAAELSDVPTEPGSQVVSVSVLVEYAFR
jgi:uncharacterized protein YggE